jgi:hypothetical protein
MTTLLRVVHGIPTLPVISTRRSWRGAHLLLAVPLEVDVHGGSLVAQSDAGAGFACARAIQDGNLETVAAWCRNVCASPNGCRCLVVVALVTGAMLAFRQSTGEWLGLQKRGRRKSPWGLSFDLLCESAIVSVLSCLERATFDEDVTDLRSGSANQNYVFEEGAGIGGSREMLRRVTIGLGTTRAIRQGPTNVKQVRSSGRRMIYRARSAWGISPLLWEGEACPAREAVRDRHLPPCLYARCLHVARSLPGTARDALPCARHNHSRHPSLISKLHGLVITSSWVLPL